MGFDFALAQSAVEFRFVFARSTADFLDTGFLFCPETFLKIFHSFSENLISFFETNIPKKGTTRIKIFFYTVVKTENFDILFCYRIITKKKKTSFTTEKQFQRDGLSSSIHTLDSDITAWCYLLSYGNAEILEAFDSTDLFQFVIPNEIVGGFYNYLKFIQNSAMLNTIDFQYTNYNKINKNTIKSFLFDIFFTAYNYQTILLKNYLITRHEILFFSLEIL